MDRYERLKTLGRGAFGVAVLVREKAANSFGSPGPLRVIKDVDLGQLPASARKEAQKEVLVLARFKHPNIVEYFTAFINPDKQSLHIVMEYADGGDLSTIVRQRKDDNSRFSECDALVILGQSLEALVHIHSKNVLHRDIKCQNIFCMKSGTVKLGDFGIARVLEHTASAAKTMIGTPNYLAPEVCENAPYNDRADIWSLGVVFYELLTLQQPFHAYNMAALVLKIVTAEPAPLPDDYGEDVRDIVQRTLQKKPDRRPGAAELLNLPAVRCLVGSRFQLTENTSRSAVKTPSVLLAGGGTSHSTSSPGHDYLKVEGSVEDRFHVLHDEGCTAKDGIDILRQQLEAEATIPLGGMDSRPTLRPSSRTSTGREQERLSPKEQARMNKARAEGTTTDWTFSQQLCDVGGNTQPRGLQANRESSSPWDWHSVSAQAELERQRNKERLTKQNWRGPGLGGVANQEDEHIDRHATTRLPTGTNRQSRSSSASSLGVAGSVVARSRPEALAGFPPDSHSHAASSAGSPGPTSRLNTSRSDAPGSSRPSSTHGCHAEGHRPTTGAGAGIAYASASSPGRTLGRHHGSSGPDDATQRCPNFARTPQRLEEDILQEGRSLGQPANTRVRHHVGSATRGGSDARLPGTGGGTPAHLVRRGRESGASQHGCPSTQGMSSSVTNRTGTPSSSLRSGPSRQESKRSVPEEVAAAARVHEPEGGDLPPTPAMLAERFAWASRFANAPLDMQLPAYADSRGERERLGELDNLFDELARLTNDKTKENPDEDRLVIPEGHGFSPQEEGEDFTRGEMTEDWGGAEMFNDVDGCTRDITMFQDGTASRAGVLAAALKA